MMLNVRNNPREGHLLQSVMKIFYKVVIKPKNYSWMIDNLNRHIIIFKYYISFGLEWSLRVKVDTLMSTSLRWISHVAQKVFYKGAKKNKTKFQKHQLRMKEYKKSLSEELTKAMDWFRVIKYSIHFAAWYTMVF